MPIDNSPLTQGSLQFIGISANKLMFKGINIIQSTKNYNIVCDFICWNQNVLNMKIMDTSLKMPKEDLHVGIGGKWLVLRDYNEIRVSIILKMLIFASFKASGSTFSCLHQGSLMKQPSPYGTKGNQY